MTDKLITNVEQWFRDRGITTENGVTIVDQYKKMQEEVAELGEAIEILTTCHPMCSAVAEDMCNDIDLELGDVVVVAIGLAKLHGTDIRTCLSKAYAKIEHRKGKLIGGQWVKEEDL